MSESLVGDLRAAAAAVEKAGIPNELQAAAFSAAFWSSRSLSTAAQHSPAAPAISDEPGRQKVVEALAKKFGVETGVIEFAYEFADGDIALRVPPSRLAEKSSDEVAEIVYLVASARQAAGLDGATSAKVLREACSDRGNRDSNFSRILGDMHGKGVLVGGSGAGRTVRVDARGFEMASELLQRLATTPD